METDSASISSSSGEDAQKSSTSITVHSQSSTELIVDEPSITSTKDDLVDSYLDDAKSTADAERKRKIRVGAMMSVAYASNIGGTASLIGSSPQLALKGLLQ